VRGRGGLLRALIGVAVSVAFLALTLSRVDLAEVGRDLAAVAPAGLLLAIALALVELGLRAARWRLLLTPTANVPWRAAVQYLSIGFVANTILPARLGDVARAMLAGRALGVARMTVFGTIVVERLTDGFSILAIVAILGLGLPSMGTLGTAASTLVLIAALGGLVVLATLVVARRVPGRLALFVRGVMERLVDGAAYLRTPRGVAIVLAATLAAFSLAALEFWVIARATGVDLTWQMAAFGMGSVALSTAVPAAPGSIGTYEFVGSTVLIALGVGASQALAVVLLVHLVIALTPGAVGLVSMWRIGFRVGELSAAEQTMGAVPE